MGDIPSFVFRSANRREAKPSMGHDPKGDADDSEEDGAPVRREGPEEDPGYRKENGVDRGKQEDRDIGEREAQGREALHGPLRNGEGECAEEEQGKEHIFHGPPIE